VQLLKNIRWVPCHHGMARPQVANGEDGLKMCRGAANILNMQSRTADKACSSSLGVGRGAKNSSSQKMSFLLHVTLPFIFFKTRKVG
jgi:hypothetical protein